MRLKYIVIAVIAFIAYTLGAKAGTSRYKEIAGWFGSFWNDPQVVKARSQAKKDVDKARKAAVKKAKKRHR